MYMTYNRNQKYMVTEININRKYKNIMLKEIKININGYICHVHR